MNFNDTTVNIKISIGVPLGEWERKSKANCYDIFRFHHMIKKGKRPMNIICLPTWVAKRYSCSIDIPGSVSLSNHDSALC